MALKTKEQNKEINYVQFNTPEAPVLSVLCYFNIFCHSEDGGMAEGYELLLCCVKSSLNTTHHLELYFLASSISAVQ